MASFAIEWFIVLIFYALCLQILQFFSAASSH